MEWMGPEQGSTLDAWMQQWIEGFLRVGGMTFLAVAVAFALVAVLGAWGVVLVRRRFWCGVMDREVDVEFVSRGSTPRFVAVKSCSAFHPPTAVSCDQRCVDPQCRGGDEVAKDEASTPSGRGRSLLP
jgi:hypothetical protein